MVHPDTKDFMIGFVIYKLLNPDFKLDPNQAPPECPNTNFYLDGGCLDLYYTVFCCSTTNNTSFEISLAWKNVCTNFEEVKNDCLDTFMYRYAHTYKTAKSDKPEVSQNYAQTLLPRMTEIANKLGIPLKLDVQN